MPQSESGRSIRAEHTPAKSSQGNQARCEPDTKGLERYYAELEDSMAVDGLLERSRDVYRRSARMMMKAIAERRGKCPLHWTEEDLRWYRVALDKELGRSGEGYRRNTQIVHVIVANRMISCVAAVNKRLAERGEIDEDEAFTSSIVLKTPRRERTKRTPMSVEEIGAIRDAAWKLPDSNMARAAIDLLYYALLRQSEARDLRLGDVDFSAKMVYVRNAKGGNHEEVPLHPTLADTIRNYLKHREGPDGDDAPLLEQNGRPLTKSNLYSLVKKAARKANVTKNVYPHIFRHSAISHMDANGMTPRQIAAWSRHKDLGTLMETYTHPSHRLVVEKGTQALFSPGGGGPLDSQANGNNANTREQLLDALLAKYLEGKVSDDVYFRTLDAYGVGPPNGGSKADHAAGRSGPNNDHVVVGMP